MGYIQDPDNSKKQVAVGITHPHQSFVAVMSSTERTASKAVKGSMVYDTTDTNLYVYDGTAWKSVALS
jgi:hypothetical protein